eukprot:1898264-Alexandrium_andersonii.AAC.1
MLSETTLRQHATKAGVARAVGLAGVQTAARRLQGQRAIKFACADDCALFIASFREVPVNWMDERAGVEANVRAVRGAAAQGGQKG